MATPSSGDQDATGVVWSLRPAVTKLADLADVHQMLARKVPNQHTAVLERRSNTGAEPPAREARANGFKVVLEEGNRLWRRMWRMQGARAGETARKQDASLLPLYLKVSPLVKVHPDGSPIGVFFAQMRLLDDIKRHIPGEKYLTRQFDRH